MKSNTEKVSQIAFLLGRILKSRNRSTGADDLFDEFLKLGQWDGTRLLNLHGVHDAFASHLHVGAFRKLPEVPITKRSLPINATTIPWHNLLDNGSGSNESERPQNVVSRALKKLDVPYQVATRILQVVAYMPASHKGENPTPVKDSGFTDVELVFQDDAHVPHSIHSLGSGIGVIVPVVVALSTTDTDLLSIEEPESHIHPKLQAELGDIVIESSLGNKGTRIFIETHSEHLILRILRRIRETTVKDFDDWPDALKEACPDGIKPEDVAVLFVDPGDNGAKVIELPVTPDGDFSRPWPGGFFAERDNELF